MFNEEVFWKDGFDGECRGGIFIRAFDLRKFLELVEANENGNGGEVVGLRFDDNNLEIISVVKSVLRFGACYFLFNEQFGNAAITFALAEVLGIVEEL